MNKELNLRILMLLSALESWSFAKDKGFLPEYLYEELKTIIDHLLEETLK